MMMYPMLDMFGRHCHYKGVPLCMHPMLDNMGVMQKDPKTGQPMMFPSGVPLLQNGQLVKISFNDVILNPQMDRTGRFPVITQKGEVEMYPAPIPMKRADG
jgi:hypothetical protein